MSLFPLQVWHYRHRQSQDFVQGKVLQGEIYSIAFSLTSREEARYYNIHPHALTTNETLLDIKQSHPM